MKHSIMSVIKQGGIWLTVQCILYITFHYRPTGHDGRALQSCTNTVSQSLNQRRVHSETLLSGHNTDRQTDRQTEREIESDRETETNLSTPLCV